MADTLLLRADASAEIGTGHVMRCLALALAWRAQGGRAVFVSRLPGPLAQRIQAEGFDMVECRTQPGGAEDLKLVGSLLRGIEHPWIALDGYLFQPGYSTALRALGRVLAVDDYGAARFADADMHLDQNLDGGRPGGYPEDALALLGPRYALLRPEFYSPPARDPHRPCRQVLVTLGGSDLAGLTSAVLETLARVLPEGVRCLTVAGAANPRVEELRALTRRLGPAYELRDNVADMAALMAQTDLAVTAAGSTVWELACLGVPAVALPLADNQIPVADALKRHGLALCLDPVRPENREECLAHLAELAGVLLQDSALRGGLARVGQALVDGQGARRVVQAMLPARLLLCPANRTHLEFLWGIANDDAVRKFSFSPDSIDLETHTRWYEQKLTSQNTKIWIAEYENRLIGAIRYDKISGTCADIDIAVIQQYRGKGLGSVMLRFSEQMAYSGLHVDVLRGIVHMDNIASSKCFINSGYSESGRSKINGIECVTYEKRRGAQ